MYNAIKHLYSIRYSVDKNNTIIIKNVPSNFTQQIKKKLGLKVGIKITTRFIEV